MRLELLTEPPIAVANDTKIILDGRRQDGSGARVAVGSLVRLLVGAAGQPLDPTELHDDIGLGRRDKKIDDLLTPIRQALGEDRLKRPRTAPDGTRWPRARVALDLTGIELDTAEFETVAAKASELLAGVDDKARAPEMAGPGFQSQLDDWLTAFRQFRANPGLPDSSFSFAVDIYNRFADLRNDLLVAIAVAYAAKFLNDGNELSLTQALTHMDSAGGDLDDDAWHLRFRLAGTLSNWKTAVPDLRTKYLAATGEDSLPLEITSLMTLIERRDKGALLTPRSSPSSAGPSVASSNDSSPESAKEGSAESGGIPTPNGEEFMNAIRTLGITRYTSLELRGPTMTPIECCRRVIRRLWFSGIMANKWVLDADAFEAFDQLLTRLDTEDELQMVRLMIVNPAGDAARLLKARGMLGAKELASIPVLQDLVQRHPSFEVRMYDTMPLFRLIIVDDQFVTVGPYLNRPEVLPRSGWEVPQLSLAPTAPYPLSQAFVGLFEETWRRNVRNGLPLP